MRVLVFDGPHAFHIEERPLPQPGPGEVRVRIAYVGICGSDLHGYTGESGRRVPGMVMGHEASGWVEALGEAVSTLTIGQPVTFNPAIACNGSCGHRVENQCARLSVIGVAPDRQGAFAEAIVVPVDRVVSLEGLSLQWGAAVEPVAVALQAIYRAALEPEDSVLIIGGGMIGQCLALAARLVGAGRIVLSEAVASRRALAIEAGFEAISPADVTDLPPMNRAFDAVGVSTTASTAIRSLIKGGTACFVGLGQPEVSIPLFDVVVPERTIVGTFAYSDLVFRQTVEYLAGRRLDLQPLLGGVEDFNGIAAAFEDLANGRREEVKIMLATNASAPERSR
ncbi:MAG TPA: alcohol dehydrogenase catalytic domain-containing protein [Acidimicrobiia bacterium]|nr:alcohol dehydrogenase catalytic domain-containing protein [Acidimicrobiia bacterium]